MDVLTPDYGAILSPASLDLPLDIGALGRGKFAGAELEIGFGNGEYTARYARAHPEVLLFGVEVSPACVLRCARRAGGLGNLRLIRTDARFMMKELFADESLDRVYMNFPCPWPKNRHAHRRVTARDFADGLAAVLKVGGVFELLTDDEPYAREAQERLGAHEALEAGELETNPSRPVTTKYERKWLEQGKDIFRLTFAKTRAFTAARQTWRESTMHVKTETQPSAGALASLNGVSGRKGDARWAFGRCYSGGGSFLLDTFSTDGEFDQRYYIRISEREDGALLRLDRTANAFLTPAVRCALQDAADRLSGRA